MFQYLLDNWKTTSAGLTTIIGSVVHLIFSINSGTATETVWTVSLTAIVLALGLIFARDASGAKKAHEESKALIADLTEKVEATNDAVITGDTSEITKTQFQTPKP